MSNVITRTACNVWDWVNARAPALAPMYRKHMSEYYAPKNFNFWYYFGSLALLVLVGVCTHLGCAPEFLPEVKPQPFDAEWKGGYFCPCHKSKYDIAGRVYKSQPAPLALPVPPYHFQDDNTLVIGVAPTGAA